MRLVRIYGTCNYFIEALRNVIHCFNAFFRSAMSDSDAEFDEFVEQMEEIEREREARGDSAQAVLA